jgi:oxalate decarboxylase/phosphoglucose isomerase-like protein (cupin superfamily)
MPPLRVEPIVLHQDERGTLHKLLPRAVPGEVYLVTARPGASRGHHIHHKAGEWFAGVSGTGVVRAIDPDNGEVEEADLQGVRVHVPAGWAHALFNRGEEDLVVVAMADRPHDPEDSHPCRVPPK